MTSQRSFDMPDKYIPTWLMFAMWDGRGKRSGRVLFKLIQDGKLAGKTVRIKNALSTDPEVHDALVAMAKVSNVTTVDYSRGEME